MATGSMAVPVTVSRLTTARTPTRRWTAFSASMRWAQLVTLPWSVTTPDDTVVAMRSSGR